MLLLVVIGALSAQVAEGRTSASGVDNSSGFTAGSLALNGSAALSGTTLRLTDGKGFEAASAFSNTLVNVQAFTNDFTFQLSGASADGFMFVLQNQGLTALGAYGGDLGYGEGTGGIQKSVAIKFDLYSNDGEGADSTGLFTAGARPTLPSTDLTSTGLNLHSGNIIQAHMTYDGSTLQVLLTDSVTGATATQSYTVNIPALVGSNAAYAGFTAGTGGLSATQNILTWKFTPGLNTSSSGFTAGSLALNGSAALSGTTLRLTDGKDFEAASAFSPTLVNVQAFTNDFTFQLSGASADGFMFVLQNQGLTALGAYGGDLGYGEGTGGIQKSVAIKFDLYSNDGEGADSTGLFTTGARPTLPSTDLTSTGLNLHSGNIIQAHMTYDGSTLQVLLTDSVTGATATQSYTVNIPALVGSNAAYAGFTAGTGGLSATQNILTWKFTPGLNTNGSGFTAGSLALNGSAALSGTSLQLTDGKDFEAASAFSPTLVNVQAFTNDFTFQLSGASADGFMFVLQNQGLTALGAYGGDLGYGEGTGGIQKSVAIKFDLYSNDGEGADSTGLFTAGARPTLPSTDLTSTGLNLHSGNIIQAHMTYDGSTLQVLLTDSVTGATATQSYTVNIPALAGSNAAYAGFTAGTGGLSATQNILTWKFASGTPFASPVASPQGGTYAAAQQVTLSDTSAGASLFYTLDGSVPTSSSTLYTGPITIGATATLRAIAVLNGVASLPSTQTYTIPTVTSSQVIKHVVVIFDENVSFDHYFATYPFATNPAGETSFTAATGTPIPNGLSGTLLTANPNRTNSANAQGATNPFRLDPKQALTSDQDHDYTAEQIAFDKGAMDLFPYSLGVPDSMSLLNSTGGAAIDATNGLTMGYYDGNTVTALWNYAQRYALNDHAFTTNFGPSTPGAINLVSGQTNGAVSTPPGASSLVSDGSGGFTLVGDSDPTGDICSGGGNTVQMTGPNIGTMLTAAKITWGFFAGGFDLTQVNVNGSTGCGRNTTSAISGMNRGDYVPHHEPFQYYAATANPNHKRPSTVMSIGSDDQSNHQYDLHDFTDTLAVGNMPAVSFLKAIATQDGHAGYSDPLDEQAFLVNTINTIQQSSFWSSTAIIILYDDSDGWYDHATMVVNGSATAYDAFSGNSQCASGTATSLNALPGVNSTTLHAQGRCGYGPRIPFLVVSPWSRRNVVDSTLIDQTSVAKFIEDTFLSGTRMGSGSFDSLAGSLVNMFDFSTQSVPNAGVVLLDPKTGLVTSPN